MASGATLNVGPSVPVLSDAGQTLTDNGALTFATGDTMTSKRQLRGVTQIVVNGTLTANGDHLHHWRQRRRLASQVNSGGATHRYQQYLRRQPADV